MPSPENSEHDGRNHIGCLNRAHQNGRISDQINSVLFIDLSVFEILHTTTTYRDA
jgi:hypothetical protein